MNKLNLHKWYIISSPCQGKTHFVNKHKKKYGEYNLYDFDDVKKNTETGDFRIFNYNKKIKHPSVILGKMHEPNFDICNYVLVQIPHDKLLKNIDSRKKSSRKNCNWAKRENVERAYNELNGFDVKYKIPKFNSFEEALIYINNKHGK